MEQKKLFNFYLENNIKFACIEKLEKYMGKKEKGAFASLIRVLLKEFLKYDAIMATDIIDLVAEEYEYSQKKNKRSTM